jgi:Domain of unknown function (DUF4164)
MAESDKLDQVFDRFESAMRKFEAALATRGSNAVRVETLEGETDALRKDHIRITSELELVRVKAHELVDTSQQAVGKIDSAMTRIRSVLHSNSGE